MADDLKDKSPSTTAPQRLDGLRILVLDDNQQYAMLLVRMLESFGAHCFPAFVVQEALRILVHNDPHAAVVDLLLFDGNGFEFIARVKKVMPELPCVLHTSLPLPEGYVPEVVYLPKPCEAADLVSAIIEAIGRAKADPNAAVPPDGVS